MYDDCMFESFRANNHYFSFRIPTQGLWHLEHPAADDNCNRRGDDVRKDCHFTFRQSSVSIN